jgi:tetratricopeptide (TPR) repeat protein
MQTPSPLIDAIFNRAFALHAKNDLLAARVIYDTLMDVAPEDARAWHWSGVIEMGAQQAQSALDLISKAITLDAANATYFLNLGNALSALKRDEDALHAYGAAIAIRPGYEQANLNLGNTYRRLKRFEESLQSYDDAIDCKPDYASAHFNRGNVLREMGRNDDALVSYDQALQLDGTDTDAWSNRGNVLRDMGRFDGSLASFDKVIEIDPAFAKAWSNRGLVLHDLKRYDEAIVSYDTAIGLKPGYVNALCNKGNSLRSLKRHDEAMQCYEVALSLEPGYAEAHCNKGLLLKNMDEPERAMISFNDAIQASPDLAEAWSNRAMIHKTQGDFAASLKDQNRALALKPNFADAWSNKGLILHDLNRIDEAIACFDSALAIAPQHLEANWNKSLDLILSGRLSEGWPLYEWRLQKDGKAPPHEYKGKPRWTPNMDLSGKTLLLIHEQGLGDTLQFCRYAKLLENQGTQVLMEVPKDLVSIVQSLSPHIRVHETDACTEPFDAFCPMMSLPLAFDTRMETIPAWASYLSPPPVKVAQWRTRLGQTQGKTIGLVCSGNPKHENTHNRDIDMSALLGALPDAFNYIVLQKQISPSEHAAINDSALRIRQFADDLQTFEDTAALCANMDIIISVDTSVAHMAAAIGKPVWLMLPWVPDWRWFQNQTNTPWYPSVRLFRQSEQADWEPVLADIVIALQQHVPGGAVD